MFYSGMGNGPEDLPSNYIYSIRMWTDGSCYPQHGPGGWAARIDYLYQNFPMGSQYIWGHGALQTNQTAEMNAIRDGLLHIPTYITADSIELISDSQWSVRILNGEYRKKVYFAEWAAIEKEFARFPNITYTHIRGHQDRHQFDFGTVDYIRVVGNNECDAISGWARTSSDITPRAFKLKGFLINDR